MRKDTFYALGGLSLSLWIFMSYILFVYRPNHLENSDDLSDDSIESLKRRIHSLEVKIKDQESENNLLLNKLSSIFKETQSLDDENEGAIKEIKEGNGLTTTLKSSEIVIPILMFSCNRVSVSKALDLLIAYRPDKNKFPIIVSQDCGHEATANVIKKYGDQILSIKQPDLSDIEIPKKERKFKGYFKIARHYGWALNETFNKYNYNQVIIVEDDLEVSPDFYEYFLATLPILKSDPTLWCVSAWNDNGKSDLIDIHSPNKLYRSDFFGGLGWMITKDLWTKELSQKWPKSYWDDWMRQPSQRKNRACIRPEISRTKTFGKIGVSNGLFFDKHLKFIVLSDKFIPFTAMNLTYLVKSTYDAKLVKEINNTPVVNINDIKNKQIPHDKPVRVIYHTKDNFKKIAKVLGIMDDFKSGVPRMAYKGIVSTYFKNRRIYVAPNNNWRGYDPRW